MISHKSAKNSTTTRPLFGQQRQGKRGREHKTTSYPDRHSTHTACNNHVFFMSITAALSPYKLCMYAFMQCISPYIPWASCPDCSSPVFVFYSFTVHLKLPVLHECAQTWQHISELLFCLFSSVLLTSNACKVKFFCGCRHNWRQKDQLKQTLDFTIERSLTERHDGNTNSWLIS